MKTNLILFAILSTFFVSVNADDVLGNEATQTIILSGSGQPSPHIIELSEPVAKYTILTATIDFTFDVTYYSEYTIHLVSDYFEIEKGATFTVTPSDY